MPASTAAQRFACKDAPERRTSHVCFAAGCPAPAHTRDAAGFALRKPTTRFAPAACALERRAVVDAASPPDTQHSAARRLEPTARSALQPPQRARCALKRQGWSRSRRARGSARHRREARRELERCALSCAGRPDAPLDYRAGVRLAAPPETIREHPAPAARLRRAQRSDERITTTKPLQSITQTLHLQFSTTRPPA